MADIVIRGMEEPKRCSACRMLKGDADDGFCHAANKWIDDEWFRWYQYPEGDIATDKPLNCPLVPLPEGHGRLGDLDRLFEVMGQDADRWIVDEVSMIETDDVLDAIQNAPTIVPAEGETDDGN